MESAGYDVFDIGIDIPAETFVEKAKEVDADFVAMSAMLTTTMKEMKIIVDLLKEAGLSEKVKPIIGGASVTQKFADEIGAYFAFDAAAAVELLKELSAG
jgi:5-methyltetrahydrofolate--homocysteine methyltransferase